MQVRTILFLLFTSCLPAFTGTCAAAQESTPADDVAITLAQKHNCFTCHAIDHKIVGPAWQNVAEKYRNDPGAEARLIKKVSNGGGGVWGELTMPPFSPFVSDAEIKTLVRFVLSLKKPDTAPVDTTASPVKPN